MSVPPEEFDRIHAGWEVWASDGRVGLVANKIIGKDDLYLHVQVLAPREADLRVPFKCVAGVEAGRVHLTLTCQELLAEVWKKRGVRG